MAKHLCLSIKMNNIIYISGSHGSGKSTLTKELTKRNPKLFLQYDKLDIPKEDDPLIRNKIRTARFYLQAVEQKNLADQNPNKVLLCDRSIADNFAYMVGFMDLEWITPYDLNEFMTLYKTLFDVEYRPQRIIFLHPSIESIQGNIRKRWKESKEVKWREDDFNYLESVRRGYEYTHALFPNSLVIRDEDLERKVSKVIGWLRKEEIRASV